MNGSTLALGLTTGLAAAGFLMRPRGSRATDLTITEHPSIFDYSRLHGEPVHQLRLHEATAHPPDPREAYFGPLATEKQYKNPETGRVWRTPRVLSLPHVPPDVVGFLDYHVIPYTNGAIYLDFYNVRRDRRGLGYGTRLVDELYLRFADAPWIDWGRVVSDRAEATMRRIQRDPGMPRTHGKIR